MKSPRQFCVVLLLLFANVSFRAAAQEDAPSAGIPADTAPSRDADTAGTSGLEPADYGGSPEPEDNTGTAAAQSPVPETPDTTEFFIRNISFDITGFSRKFALLYHTEITQGERITGRENLEKYRLDKIQLLMNQRALEFADIRCFEGAALEDGSVPVDLLIITKDTWNIIALPKPQYDDNTGFELTLKARDYNFLGTLSPLRVDLGYTLDADKMEDPSKGAFNFAIDADIPFRVFNLNWNINFDHAFSYTYEEPLYYKNTTGLSMELPVSFTTFTFGFDQSTIVNEDNEDAYPDDYDEAIHGGRWLPVYFTSATYVSWKIPTPREIGRFGRLSYTPKISGQINYLPAGQGYIDDLRRGPTATLGHSLGFSRIDWIDNYRSGLEASIGNSNTYNFHKKDWDVSYDISAVYHHIFTGFFGISSRVQYREWLDTYTKTAGDVIRGVLDKKLYADYRLSLNLDFPLRVLRFVPSQWFNTSRLRLFNFDLHFSPFFDIALLRDPVNDTEFWSKPVMGAGFEIIVFPHFFRSFYLRVSFGYDVNATIEAGKPNNWDELFIGIGHYY
ncbi:MAG: hypothetical protein LBF77_05415 [Spirochaetaceae bacterium]|jgi:hypothetical protein|nr:hypothetical protein [Spirochaetaceae bacterium]